MLDQLAGKPGAEHVTKVLALMQDFRPGDQSAHWVHWAPTPKRKRVPTACLGSYRRTRTRSQIMRDGDGRIGSVLCVSEGRNGSLEVFRD